MPNELDQLNLSQQSTLPPELFAQQQALNRKQQMAAMLMQQNQQPQGQMVSGRYVPTSFFQNLQPVANMLTGAYLAKQGDTEAAKLAEQLRQGREEEKQAAAKAIQSGKVADILSLPNQYGGVTPFMGAAITASTKPQETKVVGNHLVDATGKVLYSAPKEYAPHAVQMIDTPQGLMQFDPNTRQLTPAIVNGKPVMGTKGNLPEGATNQLTGVENVKSALKDLKTNLKDFSTFDMANPGKRALMSTDYENTILQLKEAMKLGVLNGNDYTILTSMITDPNSPKALLLDKKTQMQQIENVTKKLDEMTKNVYKTHNREVPSNLQTPTAPPVPKIDPALLQYMTPEQRKLFGG